jgi:hypothetical protein
MKRLLLLLMISISACKGNQGSAGPQGPVGIPGETGPQGAIGPTGASGANGINGANGSNGTIITVVQFCPGVDPSYPSTFPEVGLCINNNIYAVYSANDGFLTLITPGLYESNAVGSSCTFTVGDNCEITN